METQVQIQDVKGKTEGTQIHKLLSYASRLRILDLRFEIEFLSDVVLPTYKGSTLHGGFGRALRQLHCTCAAKPDISGDYSNNAQPASQSSGVCPYHFIFETKINDDAFRFLRSVPSVPHPYLIEPSLEDTKEYRAGELIPFTIRLFGSATAYAVNVIEAVSLFGKLGITRRKVPFRIVKAASNDRAGKSKIIYDGALNKYVTIPKPFHWKPAENVSFSDQLTIRFLTPTRLVQAEHLKDNVDLSIIITSISRRLAALAYYAEGVKGVARIIDGRRVPTDEIAVGGISLKWKDYRRYSNRQSSSMLFGGIVGEVTFGNVSEDYLQLLQFGTLLHLGKQTTFGLGKYEIVPK